MPSTTPDVPRIYDEEGDRLVQADKRSPRVILIPSGNPREASTDRDRIRIQWGQMLLADLLDAGGEELGLRRRQQLQHQAAAL